MKKISLNCIKSYSNLSLVKQKYSTGFGFSSVVVWRILIVFHQKTQFEFF